jgi:predicted TIM-barrel fold metal-dependent hydrolase
MNSSDFPHYDGDDIDTIEIYIPDDIKENVLHHNAAEFYNLPQRI